jgi:hypothetical protein
MTSATRSLMASDRVDRMLRRVRRERARLLARQPAGWLARYTVLGGKATWLAVRLDRELGREFAAQVRGR